MGENEFIEKIYGELKDRNACARILPIKYFNILIDELKDIYRQGMFDEAVYREYLPYFYNKTSQPPSTAKSIIITAAMQPQQRVTFNQESGKAHFMVPPTYTIGTDHVIEQVLSNLLKPLDYHLYSARLPLKLLVVHSGLAKYGRNNIAYIKGMGSFHRLKAFFSDIPFKDDNWFELTMLEHCNNCDACIKKCPTEAINRSRFVIKQEKCLTFHNERNVAFPKWIDPAWHNCLIGCMSCQICCPADANYREWVVDETSFNKDETKIILSGNENKLTNLMKIKLQRVGLLEDYKIMKRNLRVLLDQTSP